ncbi:MAG: hypothetical protein K0U64_05095 [Actinomycetia bacterium]|nr:hypothetical protein [Actinomycetes bacterium]
MTDSQSPSLQPEVLALLRCPCPEHGDLNLNAGETELTCLTCGRVFPVRDGIPVMLLDEASDPDNA